MQSPAAAIFCQVDAFSAVRITLLLLSATWTECAFCAVQLSHIASSEQLPMMCRGSMTLPLDLLILAPLDFPAKRAAAVFDGAVLVEPVALASLKVAVVMRPRDLDAALAELHVEEQRVSPMVPRTLSWTTTSASCWRRACSRRAAPVRAAAHDAMAPLRLHCTSTLVAPPRCARPIPAWAIQRVIVTHRHHRHIPVLGRAGGQRVIIIFALGV